MPRLAAQGGSGLAKNLGGRIPTGYTYYRSVDRAKASATLAERRSAARDLGRHRFHPTLSEPDYLLLKRRKKILQDFLAAVPGTALRVLDVGGRIQPYRDLLGGRHVFYFAIDPQFDGLVDVVAFGEELPIASGAIDLVLCTQVLTYAKDPEALVKEALRVLRPGGVLLLTVPSFFPGHHDERWRFLPEGIELLLSGWVGIEILPEGHSVTGLVRTLNVCLASVESDRLRRAFQHSLIPLLNLIGEFGERFRPSGTMLTANYCVMAQKPDAANRDPALTSPHPSPRSERTAACPPADTPRSPPVPRRRSASR